MSDLIWSAVFQVHLRLSHLHQQQEDAGWGTQDPHREGLSFCLYVGAAEAPIRYRPSIDPAAPVLSPGGGEPVLRRDPWRFDGCRDERLRGGRTRPHPSQMLPGPNTAPDPSWFCSGSVCLPEQDASQGVEPGRPVQRSGQSPAEADGRQSVSGQVQIP